MSRAKEGAATAARIAAIVIVISNSVSVKPVSFLIGRFTAFASVYRPARNCDAGARFADLEILVVQTISKPVLVGYDIQGQRLSGSSDKGSIVNGLSDLHAAGPDLVTDLSVHLTSVVVSTTSGIPRHLRDAAYAGNGSPRRAPDPAVIEEHGREALIGSLRDAFESGATVIEANGEAQQEASSDTLSSPNGKFVTTRESRFDAFAQGRNCVPV